MALTTSESMGKAPERCRQCGLIVRGALVPNRQGDMVGVCCAPPEYKTLLVEMEATSEPEPEQAEYPPCGGCSVCQRNAELDAFAALGGEVTKTRDVCLNMSSYGRLERWHRMQVREGDRLNPVNHR